MMVVHGETLWSPTPQPIDDDDDVTRGILTKGKLLMRRDMEVQGESGKSITF